MARKANLKFLTESQLKNLKDNPQFSVEWKAALEIEHLRNEAGYQRTRADRLNFEVKEYRELFEKNRIGGVVVDI